MAVDLFLFVAIAEIAGIFVGFGALIGVTRPNEIVAAQLARLRGLVTIGLTIIITSLIPVALDLYGVTDHTLWFTSSLFFYSFNWILIIMSFRDPVNRELMKNEMQRSPVKTVFFWLLLEVPFHVLLILTILGLFPHLEPAFYTTALLIYLFQAAFALVLLVYSQADTPSSEE
ncbi:MAG: hypothetical protein ACXADB_07365 [Candidatus Hermodarchaeia archaeon]|jgi:hypothetical protein